MSYSAYESSVDSGAVVELYEFVQGLQRFNYSSCDTDITFNSHVYSPFSATRNSIKQTEDIFKDNLAMVFPRGDVFASQFLGFAPEDVTTLTIRRGHLSDPASEFIVYWKGRVIGAKTSGNEVTIDCESVFTSIKRPGLRARFEYSCRHSLYLKGCNVNRELYKLTGNILSISGSTVTIAGASLQANGFYTGGIAVAENGASRFIVSHTGDALIFSRPIPGLSGDQTMNVYPGCDHLKETCNLKFSNTVNFGGFPWIPSRNPFDGSSIV